MLYFGNLEFFVLLAQEYWNFPVDVQDAPLIQAPCVFRDVLLVVQQNLLLNLQGAAVVFVFYEGVHDGGHPAQNHVFS